AAARAAVSRHSLVRRAFGDAEVTCERVPRRYSVERDHAQFEFLVTGDPEDERSSDGTKHWAATEVARDASGVWHVTSAAFSWRRERRTTQVQLPLARSDAAPVGSGSK
ncbi:hypothetical protein HY251_11815, partial [bacterium]|nr:hypothetical protein [bacterium]